MNKSIKNLLTPFELGCLLIAIIVDISVATLPNTVVDLAKQNGWISAMLGAVYPLYVGLIAIYMSKKHPNENILALSKKYLGNNLGTILNLMFFLSFFSYFPIAMSNLNVMTKTYIVAFMSNYKMYLALLLVCGYTAYKGLKVVSKMCVINFYILLIIILGSLAILNYGSYLNVMPIMGGDFKEILKASTRSLYDYALLETIFLFYPCINNHKKLKSSILKVIGFVCLLYGWIVFITTYYLGPDLIKKTIWGFFNATESLRFEVISSFRYIFVFLWVLIGLKSIMLDYYVCIFILKDINKLFDNRLTYIIIGAIVMIITLKYYTERLNTIMIAQYSVKFSVAYNLIYITIIAILIFIKRNGIHEK